MPFNSESSLAAQPGGRSNFPWQVVLVMQGGGALGSYQAGVYQAMHEAGIEPDWIIGTSIGAINGAIIAGNKFDDRLPRLREFWHRLKRNRDENPWFKIGDLAAGIRTLTSGVPGMFAPNLAAIWGIETNVGPERASYYSTDELKQTLLDLVDFDQLNSGAVRFTSGAVSVRTGEMHYFDSRNQAIAPEQVMASSALPPAFPAVRIGGDLYWDGGIYSNTPMEVVFDDNPRRDSLVFSAQLWRSAGLEPSSIHQVLDRFKDIQFASRHKSHVARQEQLHHMRHIVRELVKRLPQAERETAAVKEMAGYGCGTTIHVLQMNAPRMNDGNLMKEMDFTTAGIDTRWAAGLSHARQTLAQKSWEIGIDPGIGVVIHDEYVEMP
jgi:NTE family protein